MMEYDINEFLDLRQAKECTDGTIPGVYLICNTQRSKYYVGQSARPADRVFTHFTGRGNGDIYVDYKNQEPFTVRFYDLNNNDFRDLNELEFHLIRIYEAQEKGYNRQKGNTTKKLLYSFSDYKKGGSKSVSEKESTKIRLNPDHFTKDYLDERKKRLAKTIVKRDFYASGVLVKDVPFYRKDDQGIANYVLSGKTFSRVAQLIRDAVQENVQTVVYADSPL